MGARPRGFMLVWNGAMAFDRCANILFGIETLGFSLECLERPRPR